MPQVPAHEDTAAPPQDIKHARFFVSRSGILPWLTLVSCCSYFTTLAETTCDCCSMCGLATFTGTPDCNRVARHLRGKRWTLSSITGARKVGVVHDEMRTRKMRTDPEKTRIHLIARLGRHSKREHGVFIRESEVVFELHHAHKVQVGCGTNRP